MKRDETADDTDTPPSPNSHNAEPLNTETEPVVPVSDNSGSNPTSGGEEPVTDPEDTTGKSNCASIDGEIVVISLLHIHYSIQ